MHGRPPIFFEFGWQNHFHYNIGGLSIIPHGTSFSGLTRIARGLMF